MKESAWIKPFSWLTSIGPSHEVASDVSLHMLSINRIMRYKRVLISMLSFQCSVLDHSR